MPGSIVDVVISRVRKAYEAYEFHVVYQALYGEERLWVRPLGMFLEHIVINGQVQPRFKCLPTQQKSDRC